MNDTATAEDSLWSTVMAVLRFLWDNPVIPLSVLALVGINIGWRKLTIRYNSSGRPLPGLGFTIKRVLRAMYLEDTTPVINRPAALAQRIAWFTWRRYWVLTTVLAVILVSRITDPLPDNVDYSLAILVGYNSIHGALHLRRVFQIRHRILMQMFEVASAECRYLKGAELNPWGYIQISKWRDLYSPDTTAIMFPPRYRSEDAQNREAFELNFNGTVSDAHTWTYRWESSNNRVIADPVPFIVEQAPYPFPDKHDWNEFPVGMAAGGKEAIIDVRTFPHLLIAGSTGSGKSVTQRTLLLHALQSPDWRVMLIDPKRVELSTYATHPHVIRVATELEESTELLEQLEQEMQSRYERMKNEGVNFFKDMQTPPPAILMMVDETFALLSMEGIKSDEGKERDEMHARCTVLIGSIARLGRAAGVHMMLATQRPDAKVIPGETRANLDARIAQGRMDTTPSLMTLDSNEATKIPPIKGRAVLRTGNDYTHFQAYFLPPEVLPQVLEMSAALATGMISPDDLTAPEEDGKKNRFAGKLRLPKPPDRVLSSVKGWAERRQQQVQANEDEARNFATRKKEKKRKPPRAVDPTDDNALYTDSDPGDLAYLPPEPHQEDFFPTPPERDLASLEPEFLDTAGIDREAEVDFLADVPPFEEPPAIPEAPEDRVIDTPASAIPAPAPPADLMDVEPAVGEPSVFDRTGVASDPFDVPDAPWMAEPPVTLPPQQGPSPFAATNEPHRSPSQDILSSPPASAPVVPPVAPPPPPPRRRPRGSVPPPPPAVD